MTILKHIPIHAITEVLGMAGSPELVERCYERAKKKALLEKGMENKNK